MSLILVEEQKKENKKIELDIISGYPKGMTEKEMLDSAYEIAQENGFHVKRSIYDEHIVGNDDFRPYFLMDENGKMQGLTVVEYPRIRNLNVCYIGLVFVRYEVQRQGWSKALMTRALADSETPPDIITLRTQNSRMLTSFINTFGNNGLYFPNPDYETPSELIEIIRELECAPNPDKNLIVRGVYPNKFVNQESHNSFAGNICAGLQEKDAVVPAIILNPNKVLQKALVPKQ